MNGFMLEGKEGLSYSHILPKTNLATENGWLEDKPLLLKWFLFRGHVDFFLGGYPISKPISSMYGILTYIYHTYQPNVGKYTIHGSSGKCKDLLVFHKIELHTIPWIPGQWRQIGSHIAAVSQLVIKAPIGRAPCTCWLWCLQESWRLAIFFSMPRWKNNSLGPQNQRLEDVFPYLDSPFLGDMLIFWGCIFLVDV